VPRGGKRAGAGRKKGSPTKKTRQTAETQTASGLAMPLDVMLDVMRAYLAEGNRQVAAAIAKDAAPYCHARLSSVEHTGQLGVQLEVVEEILNHAPEGRSQNGAAAPGPGRLLP
jgi:hypothetical protein